MRKTMRERGLAFIMLAAVLLSSFSFPVQAASAANKNEIPGTAEMNQKNRVIH